LAFKFHGQAAIKLYVPLPVANGLGDVTILGLLFLRGRTVAYAEAHALKEYDHR
jgi:hypothetical protein